MVKLFVEDNWRVKAGDTLLELDPSDYQVQVNGAQAQLERARQTVDQLYAQVEAARSGLRLAESQLNQARIDFDRARQLKAQGVVSSEYYDQANTALRRRPRHRGAGEAPIDAGRGRAGGGAEDKTTCITTTTITTTTRITTGRWSSRPTAALEAAQL